MTPFTQRLILFAITLIEYAMDWDPAPVSAAVAAKVEEMRQILKSSADNLSAAENKAK